jgi:HK97 family phage major capsid protein
MPNTQTLEREVTELRAKIKEVTAEAATKQAAAEQVVEAEKAAGRNILVPQNDDDREAFKRVDAAYKESDALKQYKAELHANLTWALEHAGHEAREVADGDPRHPKVKQARSMGAIVTASDQYRQLVESGVLTQEGANFTFAPVEVANKEQTRLLLGGKRHPQFLADAGDGTPLVPSHEELIPPVEIPKRMPTLLDMITVGATGRDGVTYTRQTARTTHATTTVAFGTALNKSRYTYETVAVPILRKGHYAVVDEGNISDQEEFQGIVNGELVSDLRLIVENDALNANGNGVTQWEGIFENSGIGSVDASLQANNADALHMAITTVRVQLEDEPTAWGISPEDFEDYYLEKGQDGHYLHHRGPQEAQVRTIWGLPAMVSTGYVKPLVGHFARGAKLWVREGITIAISNNVDDFFLEGLFAIRAQTRAGFAVKQPKAFCEVTSFDMAS